MNTTDKKLACLSCGVSTDRPKEFLKHCKLHAHTQNRYFCGYCESFADSSQEFFEHPTKKPCVLHSFFELFTKEA
ncbi:hypothetical protein A9K97_gp200 [Tokyovirus A1]|uniref:hypothetical protein n=1 Tax=Tokyovirus A1 TaxID=1826170 RepID=UPI0007A96058|nr:hypothetical protein A9K97_gp200 [Tokyovirus A1]BAU80151.1 hypothetical protein [Tokyovirus A1]